MNELVEARFSSIAIAILVHFIWQATAICILVAMTHLVLGSRRAQFRYWCGVLAMGMMIAAPVSTGIYFLTNPELLAEYQLTQDLGALDASGAVVDSSRDADAKYQGLMSYAAMQYKSILGSMISARYTWLAIWLVGMGCFLVRLLVAWVFCRRIRKTGIALVGEHRRLANRLKRRLNVSMNVVIAASEHVTQAIATGIIRPVVLIPANWITEMPIHAVEAVIAHELAHIRRWDIVVNLLQRIVETTFFFHPAVWWLSRRIRQDREVCCDQMAIEVTRNKKSYVETLAKVAELNAASQPEFQFGISFFGGKKMNLLRRIRFLLEPNPPRNQSAFRVASIATMSLLLLIGFSWVSISAQAAAFQDEEHEAKQKHRVIKVQQPQGVLPPYIDLVDLPEYGQLQWVAEGDQENKFAKEAIVELLLTADENDNPAVARAVMFLQDDKQDKRKAQLLELARQLRKVADEITEDEHREKRKPIVEEIELQRSDKWREAIVDRSRNVFVERVKNQKSDERNLQQEISELQDQVKQLRQELRSLRGDGANKFQSKDRYLKLRRVEEKHGERDDLLSGDKHKNIELHEHGNLHLQVSPKAIYRYRLLPGKLHKEHKLHPEHEGLHLDIKPNLEFRFDDSTHKEHKSKKRNAEYRLEWKYELNSDKHDRDDHDSDKKARSGKEKNTWIEFEVETETDKQQPRIEKRLTKSENRFMRASENEMTFDIIVDETGKTSSENKAIGGWLRKVKPAEGNNWRATDLSSPKKEKTSKQENKKILRFREKKPSSKPAERDFTDGNPDLVQSQPNASGEENRPVSTQLNQWLDDVSTFSFFMGLAK